MTASAHTTAMQARIEHDDFIDSSSPYEGEVCTADPWPLPAGEPMAGKFDQPAKPSFWSKVNAWLGGAS